MRGFAAVGLVNPKYGHNLGGVLRAVGCFGGAMVAYEGRRVSGTFKGADTAGVHDQVPLLRVSSLREVIPYDCVPVAVELVPEAQPLPWYRHPPRAFYVFGAEDATLGRAHLGWCRDVIQIPAASCLNLAAAVNVVLYDRASKGAPMGGLGR